MKKLEPTFDYIIKKFSSKEKDVITLFSTFFKKVNMDDKT